jgi:hypothetical protein
MKDKRPVTCGQTYTVEVENTRFEVRVVRQPDDLPGWWFCETESGQPFILPEQAFLAVAD